MDGREWGGTKPFIEQPALAKNIPQWIELTRQLLPKETANIDQMLDELKFHSDNGFHWAIKRASNGTSVIKKVRKGGIQMNRLKTLILLSSLTAFFYMGWSRPGR